MDMENQPLYTATVIDTKRPGITSLLSISGLVFFIIIYAVNAYLNHEVKVAPDEFQYIYMTRTLLSGRWIIQDDLFALKKQAAGGHRVSTGIFTANPRGEPVSYYPVGIAIVLAPFYALAGKNIFWLLPMLWDITLILFLFLLVRLLVRSQYDDLALPAALAAVSLYGTVINFRLGMRRDFFCSPGVLVLSLVLYIASTQKKFREWHLGSAIIAFLTIVKISYILLYIPFILLFFATMPWRRMGLRKIMLQALPMAVVAVLIFLPFFVTNHISTGRWYFPAQITEASEFVPTGKPAGSYFLGNIAGMIAAQAYIYSPNGFPLWTALLFVVFAIAGGWFWRRNKFVLYWTVGVIVLLYSLYSTTTRKPYIYNTYLSPVYGLVCTLFILALVQGVRRFRLRARILFIIALMIMAPFAAVKMYRSLPSKRHAHFGMRQARSLAREIDSVVPKGSVIICDRDLSLALDLFCRASVTPLCYLGRTPDVVTLLERMMINNVQVFYFDFSGIGTCRSVPELIDSAFIMDPVLSNINLRNYPEKGPASSPNLYRLSIKAGQEGMSGSMSAVGSLLSTRFRSSMAQP
jgi:hypothetical protein